MAMESSPVTNEFFYFRTAAAAWGATKQPKDVLSHHSDGLVQAVADNYDCEIHLMKCLKGTYYLALMILQQGQIDKECQNEAIPRLKKTELFHVDEPIPTIQTWCKYLTEIHFNIN